MCDTCRNHWLMPAFPRVANGAYIAAMILAYLTVMLFIAVAAGVPATANDWKTEEFDARPLTYEEKRILQAALALSGDYVGLLDGEWGQASQAALERFTVRTVGTNKPRFAHLTPLLDGFARDVILVGWRTYYSDITNTSYAFPVELVTRTEAKDVLEWETSDGSLVLIVNFAELRDTLSAHSYLLSQNVPPKQPYQTFKPERLITSVSLSDSSSAYMRSDKIDGGYVSLTVFASPDQKGRMALIASSMQRGPAPELSIPTDGMLGLLLSPPVSGQPAPSNNPQLESAATPAPPHISPTGSGTGFYVNNTDIVTASHVVSGCAALALLDGSALSVIAMDATLDLAVVSSQRRSNDWLVLTDRVEPRLGEGIFAIGFPYLGTLAQGLSVTGGNISALAGIDAGKSRIMISTPIQPGNSGGPILNRSGTVLGVVVSRLDDLAILEGTGTLPQNMNFAVPAGAVRSFLETAGVFFPQAAKLDFDISDGIPPEISGSVVAIQCLN